MRRIAELLDGAIGEVRTGDENIDLILSSAPEGDRRWVRQ